jgi:hypothetical protein
MDLGSPFKPEVFRPIARLLIPGATAVAPFVIVAAHRYPVRVGATDERPGE